MILKLWFYWRNCNWIPSCICYYCCFIIFRRSGIISTRKLNKAGDDKHRYKKYSFHFFGIKN